MNYYYLKVNALYSPLNKSEAASQSLINQFHGVVISEEDIQRTIEYLRERIESFNFMFKRCKKLTFTEFNGNDQFRSHGFVTIAHKYDLVFMKVKQLELRIGIHSVPAEAASEFQSSLF